MTPPIEDIAPMPLTEAPAPAPTEEPAATFFDALEAQAAEEKALEDDMFGDLPEGPASTTAPLQADAGPAPNAPAPVPPRRPAGQPSAEALERLRAAVLKGEPSGTRPVPVAPPQSADKGDAARFGIGSLINRMTGSGDTAPVQPTAPAPQAEPEMDAEEEKIEIPAFLRRQAN
jgi:cell division protein FtsZ